MFQPKRLQQHADEILAPVAGNAERLTSQRVGVKLVLDAVADPSDRGGKLDLGGLGR
jgi:hypothetical protein